MALLGGRAALASGVFSRMAVRSAAPVRPRRSVALGCFEYCDRQWLQSLWRDALRSRPLWLGRRPRRSVALQIARTPNRRKTCAQSAHAIRKKTLLLAVRTEVGRSLRLNEADNPRLTAAQAKLSFSIIYQMALLKPSLLPARTSVGPVAERRAATANRLTQNAAHGLHYRTPLAVV